MLKLCQLWQPLLIELLQRSTRCTVSVSAAQALQLACEERQAMYTGEVVSLSHIVRCLCAWAHCLQVQRGMRQLRHLLQRGAGASGSTCQRTEAKDSCSFAGPLTRCQKAQSAQRTRCSRMMKAWQTRGKALVVHCPERWLRRHDTWLIMVCITLGECLAGKCQNFTAGDAALSLMAILS